MFGFILQKLINKKWMVASLLLGNLLLIAVASANPMYSQAVMQRTLTLDMGNYLLEHNLHPGLLVVRGNASKYEENAIGRLNSIYSDYEKLVEELDVPALLSVHKNKKSGVYSWSEKNTDRTGQFVLESYTDIAEHITVTNGEMFSEQITDNIIDVIVTESTFVDKSLMLNEIWVMKDVLDEKGNPYKLRIAGIFKNSQEADPYWLTAPGSWNNSFVVADNIFEDLFVNAQTPSGYEKTWYTVLDYEAMKCGRAEEMLQTARNGMEKIQQYENAGINIYCLEVLDAFIPKAQKLNNTISVLQAPILLLLAAFIFMVSRQMLETEQNEIAVFKSRGAAGGQILYLYFLQSVLLAAAGIVGGVPLGILLCRVIGSSNAFLEFVKRTAMPVELNEKVWLYVLGAALFSIATMAVPVFQFSKITIVAHKRQKNRKSAAPWWQKIFLDVVLLAVSLYGYYSFKGQEAYLAEKVMDGATLDPLLYYCSSLFMLGAGLLVLRILPWLIRLVFWIGKKWWSPALYASFLGIMRTQNNQGFLVVFLVITMAMGIFNTQTARTINSNGEEKIRYTVGADIVVQEQWREGTKENAVTGEMLMNAGSYKEPDFDKYLEMDGAEQVTRVFTDKVTAMVDSGRISNVRLMGIHTREFGETAWFKESLLSAHWYEYLNAMSQNTSAILVSSNFQEDYGYKLGDIITYVGSNGSSARGVIYGFVDYWPSYLPVTREKQADNIYRETKNYLIVAHLSQLQSSWGVLPYQVWIKTKGSSQFLYDYAQENNIRFLQFEDAAAKLVELKNDPVFQGTNGTLTIGFIIVLVLCASGFLIYWILSIRSRTLQFGIFRAMGMSGREVLSMLVNEQIFISGVSILGGVLVGRISSSLFVPLIQIAYSSADKAIPLEVVSLASDHIRLGAVIGLMVVVCMIILSVLISKIKITQALKLGED